MAQVVGDVNGGAHGIIGRGYLEHIDVALGEVDSVGVTFSASAGDVAVVTTVVVGGWSDVPPLNAVHCACSALLRLLVDEDAPTWRGERRAACG